ncbi:MAG: insulinase family protein [Myxococcota bacterium]|nr:insulinase family protein [Myxococcota bacterium]
MIRRSTLVCTLTALALTAGCATTTEATRPAEPAPVVEAPSPAPVRDPRAPAPAEPVPSRPLPTLSPLEVVRLPVPNKPIVSLRLVFRAGSVDDPAGKEGLTSLTGSVLEEGGTQKLTSAQLLQALYPIAGDLSVSTDKELTVFAGRIHRDNLDAFLEIFTDVLLHPRLDAKEFERLRQDHLNAVKNGLRNEDDERLGKAALDAVLYAGHPYRHYPVGTVAGLEAITLEDVRAQWQRVFTQDRLIVGLAGAVDEALEQQVLQRLSALPKTGAPRVQLPPAPGVHGQVLLIKKQTLSTAISLGSSYPVRRGDPDFFLLFFAMSYLGEHRQSNGVLFNQLRELRGLNYGDYAYAEMHHQEGYSSLPATNVARSQQHFSLWLRPVEPDTAMFATRGAVHFFDALIKDGIPAERFEVTRQFLDGFTRLWSQTDQRRLGYAIDSKLYGTPDFLEAYRAALKTMTPDQVHAALSRHYAADKLNYAYVVQDAEKLKELLTRQPPTPLTYTSEKPAQLLAEDQIISARPLPLDPASIQILDAQQFMQQ